MKATDYAYIDDRLVGFISSAIEEETEGIQWGSIQAPFIRKGHESVEGQLMQRAISALESKGVQKVRTVLREGWGDAKRILTEHGYEKGPVSHEYTNFSADSIGFPADYVKPTHIRDVDLDADLEVLAEALSDKSGRNAEEILSQLQSWREQKRRDGDELFANAIVRDGDEVLAHALALKVSRPHGTDCAHLTAINILKEGNNHLVADVFLYLVDAIKKAGLKHVRMSLRANHRKEDYEAFNLEFKEGRVYILDIS